MEMEEKQNKKSAELTLKEMFDEHIDEVATHMGVYQLCRLALLFFGAFNVLTATANLLFGGIMWMGIVSAVVAAALFLLAHLLNRSIKWQTEYLKEKRKERDALHDHR